MALGRNVRLCYLRTSVFHQAQLGFISTNRSDNLVKSDAELERLATLVVFPEGFDRMGFVFDIGKDPLLS